jgi:hypothetical protein
MLSKFIAGRAVVASQTSLKERKHVPYMKPSLKKKNLSTNVGATNAQDLGTTSYDGSVKAMVDELGSPVTTNSYTIHLPSGLTPIMFDYIQDIGLL